MKAFVPILILAALLLPAATHAKPRLMVHLSRCSGPELKKDQVLVINLSLSADLQKDLARVLEEHRLVVIRERSFRTIRSAKRAYNKAVKTAGEERCDAMIVLRMGRDTAPGIAPAPFGFPAVYSTNPEGWIEVLFAEVKPDAKKVGG